MINTYNDTVKKVYRKVEALMKGVDQAHDMSHIDRVYDLSLRFCKGTPYLDITMIELLAILHDVDDYKLFGEKSAEDLSNAAQIMAECNVNHMALEKVLAGISEIGFNKRLKGIFPSRTETEIVSDADMCDGMGVTGVIRTIQYTQAHGRPFFDKDDFPRKELTCEEYKEHPSSTAVNHIFEKLLRLPSMMLTAPGAAEAYKRRLWMTNFLRIYFSENNLPEWGEYLVKQMEG